MTAPAQRTKCKTGCGRDSRCPGTMCKPCWKKAGSPTAEQVAEQRAYDRIRAERETGAAGVAALADEPDETDVQAMEELWTRKGDPRTRRQDSFVVLYRANPQKFYETLSRLRSPRTADGSPTSTDSTPSPTSTPWNGTGTCPACARPPDRYPEDAGTERIEELLGEDFAETDRMDRHREAVLAFMDREGLT